VVAALRIDSDPGFLPFLGWGGGFFSVSNFGWRSPKRLISNGQFTQFCPALSGELDYPTANAKITPWPPPRCIDSDQEPAFPGVGGGLFFGVFRLGVVGRRLWQYGQISNF
jgi:hypothetical protein